MPGNACIDCAWINRGYDSCRETQAIAPGVDRIIMVTNAMDGPVESVPGKRSAGDPLREINRAQLRLGGPLGVERGSGVVLFGVGGDAVPLTPGGWDPFRKENRAK